MKEHILQLIKKGETEVLPDLLNKLNDQLKIKDYDLAMETCMMLIANISSLIILENLNQIK